MERKTIVCCLPGFSFSSYWVNNWTSLLSFLQSKFIVHVMMGFSNNIYMTRNQILEGLFNSEKAGAKFDYCFWMDDDNPTDVDGFKQLLEDLEEDDSLDGILGWYWLQPHGSNIPPAVSVGDFEVNCNIKNMTPQEAYKEPFIVPVEWGGFGSFLIRWNAMESVGEKSFSPIIIPESRDGFSGDDISFFIRARNLAALKQIKPLKFAVDKRVKVPHLKLRNADFDANAFIALPSEIAQAENIQGWMTRLELVWLFNRAKQMDSVIEIGSWKGRSSYALAASGTNLICIDTWQGASDEIPAWGGKSLRDVAKEEDIFKAWMNNVGSVFRNVDFLKMDSISASKLWQIGRKIIYGDNVKVDMVFIDGEHTFDAVVADIQAWQPKAKKLLCGHDIDREEVKRALEFCKIPYKKGPNEIWFYEVPQEKEQVSFSEAAD